MDKLPAELILNITSYLAPEDLLNLQLVSKAFLTFGRDDLLWRSLLYESAWRDANPSMYNAHRAQVNGLDHHATRAAPSTHSHDPIYGKEGIDWYSEYTTRNAPISIRWLQQPKSKALHGVCNREIKGMGLLKRSAYAESRRVVAPLDNGSVCVWDISQQKPGEPTASWGQVVNTSKRGILFHDHSGRTGTSARKHVNESLVGGNCVNVDSPRSRVYIAVGNCVSEVDLAALQVVSQHNYPQCVSSLSQRQVDYDAPITVATTKDLYIYDPRCPAKPGALDHTTTVQCLTAELAALDVKLLCPLPPRNSGSASLPKPMALSVLHPPLPDINTIFVAGRFPSILQYDRRFFSTLQDTIYSGARLSALTTVPEVFHLGLGRAWQNHRGLVACGEYNGKGSLEMYGFSNESSASSFWDAEPTTIDKSTVYQNRQSTSASKVLSVATHGAKLVYSDANGNVRWVERDGKTPIRVWNINHDPQSRGGREGVGRRDLDDSGDIIPETIPPVLRVLIGERGRSDFIRQLLSTGGDLTEDEILVWTGSRVASLGFYPHPTSCPKEDNDRRGPENLDTERMEREYMETLERSMRSQAHDLNRLVAEMPSTIR
ncbi:F-box domain containing protein [Coccidioides posadasii C735 delta SOWgp]|uniref:F-box domain containing protein n=1 Tax=Coccidioides posadasii (strain C735) TaxID=222929 RepID=C5PFY8_COCP7|nr:F-box domain containing protein [Coccidioides posadasii C735 delta SOWgp]EER23441.1 F-box domain containing protein [Coccidioides posadasii C735 delta SOWgp]|eukprot:XP_003065586.1 F-box domain containing protein [Coccidioides posadasii C735 delta SOWgp]